MKELFRNCLSVQEADDFLLPLRFTDAQLRTYSANEAQITRSTAPSSVMLSFKSKAKKLSLEYRITAKARPWACFDVVCDGVLYSSVAVSDDVGALEISLTGDESVETHVYLPHLVRIELKSISSDAPLIPTERKTKTYLALGDSITQGMDAKRPSSAYPVAISERFGYELINAGVGGIRFCADQLDYIGCEPDVITVALGCNDWCVEKAQLAQSVTNYIEKLLSLYKCRNIHFILPTWRSDENELKADMTFKEHREVIREAVATYPFINIIDGYTLVPCSEEHFGDAGSIKIHPTDDGFAIYAKELVKCIDF